MAAKQYSTHYLKPTVKDLLELRPAMMKLIDAAKVGLAGAYKDRTKKSGSKDDDHYGEEFCA